MVTTTGLRWRVEHRDAGGGVKNIIETPNHVMMERRLVEKIKNEWLLRDGDTIHVTRQRK